MLTPIRLIIAGTRTLQDYNLVKTWMKEVRSPILEIVSGGATGADALGERYAVEHGIPLKLFLLIGISLVLLLARFATQPWLSMPIAYYSSGMGSRVGPTTCSQK